MLSDPRCNISNINSNSNSQSVTSQNSDCTTEPSAYCNSDSKFKPHCRSLSTSLPTLTPTNTPTTTSPSLNPSASPSLSLTPTNLPTISETPTLSPSNSPSDIPTETPSDTPTVRPSVSTSMFQLKLPPQSHHQMSPPLLHLQFLLIFRLPNLGTYSLCCSQLKFLYHNQFRSDYCRFQFGSCTNFCPFCSLLLSSSLCCRL